MQPDKVSVLFIGAIRRRHRRIIIERQQPRRLHVVELIVIDRPEEESRGSQQQDDGQTQHDQHDVHAAAAPCPTSADLALARRRIRRTSRPMRSAFRMTTRELSDMPSAASHGGTKPSAAAGTAARL